MDHDNDIFGLFNDDDLNDEVDQSAHFVTQFALPPALGGQTIVNGLIPPNLQLPTAIVPSAESLLASHSRFGPSLALRYEIRQAKLLVRNSPEQREAFQLAIMQYFQNCNPELFEVSASNARRDKKKLIVPSILNHQSVSDIFLGAPSSSITHVNPDTWPDQLALAVANVTHESKTFHQGVQGARKFIKDTFNDVLTSLFQDRDLGSITRTEIYQRRLEELRDWVQRMGIIHRSTLTDPKYPWHKAESIASFDDGPLDPQTMEQKQALCDDVFNRLRNFISPSVPHPSLFGSLLLRPELFSEADALNFARMFQIPGVVESSPPNVVQGACIETGRTVLLDFLRHHDDSVSLKSIPDSWLTGIFLYLTYEVRDLCRVETIRTFMTCSRPDKERHVRDQVWAFARSIKCDSDFANWADQGDEFYEKMHAVLRLFNAFCPHGTTDHSDQVRAEVLSFKFHHSEEGTVAPFFRHLLEHLGLPLLIMRDDFTEFGPYDGKPLSPAAGPLGPATAHTRRYFMTNKTGREHVAEADRYAREHDLPRAIRPQNQYTPPPSSVGPSSVTPTSINSQAYRYQVASPRFIGQDGYNSVVEQFDRYSIAESDDIRPPPLVSNLRKRPWGYDLPDPSPRDLHGPTTVFMSKRGDWLKPPQLPAPAPSQPLQPAVDEDTRTVRRAVCRSDHFQGMVQPLSGEALHLLAKFPPTVGSDLAIGDMIMVPDPNLMTRPMPFNANSALEVPLTTLYVAGVDVAHFSLTLRVMAVNINDSDVVSVTGWPHLSRAVVVRLPDQVLKCDGDMRIRSAQLTGTRPYPSNSPPPSRGSGGPGPSPRQPDRAGSGPSDPAPSTSGSNKVALGGGVFHSKTPLNVSDKARGIAWIMASVSPELVSVATSGRGEYANSYVMERIIPSMFSYWLAEIDQGRQPRHFKHTLDVVRNCVLTTYLINSHPEIAIGAYLFDWVTPSCLNPKTSLFIEYFLPASDYHRIKTTESLYTAVSCLDKCIHVLHGWASMFSAFLQILRPIEGVFDSVCCIDFWLSRFYTMMAEIAQSVLDTRNHGDLTQAGWNKLRLSEIITRTAALPFDHASNLAFEGEAQYRFKGQDPLLIPQATRGKSTLPTASHGEPSTKPPSVGPKKDSKKPAHPTAGEGGRISAADRAAFIAAGVEMPVQPPNTPRYLLCLLDFMSFYNINFERSDKPPPKCSKQHSVERKSHYEKPSGQQSTRLHVQDLLKEFPAKYSLASAKYQTAYWLHDKPGCGSPTLGSVTDSFYQGGIAGRQGVKEVFFRPPKTRDKPTTAHASPTREVLPVIATTSKLVPTPPLVPRKPNLICQRINETLARLHGLKISPHSTSDLSFSEAIDSHAALMLQASVANSTELRYDSHWKHWEKFRARYVTTPPDECMFLTNSSLTSKVRTFCAFAAYLHSHESLRAGTVIGAMSGIRHAFRSSLCELDLFNDPRIQAVKHAAVLIDKKAGLGKANRKLPFTLDMVQHLLKWSDLKIMRFHMIAVAVQLSYFGLYRSSEIVHDPLAELHHEEHALRTSDVVFFVGPDRKLVNYSDAHTIEFSTIDSMRLILRSAKNDQSRRGKKTFFTAQDLGPNTINMVRVMYDWAVRSKVQHGGILLAYWDTAKGAASHLTYNHLSNTIKTVATRMGFSKSLYAAHSPRIGGASTLRACQIPDPTIQMMGKWDSAETPKTYEEDNVREFIECQKVLANSVHYSSAIVHLFQDSYLQPPSNPRELDLCAEAV